LLSLAAAAWSLARRLAAVLALSVGLAGLAGVAGLVLSFHLHVAAGASVALCAVALALPALRALAA
jgi:ABC-type Mn2+/Zn2+ transport system permease subunit